MTMTAHQSMLLPIMRALMGMIPNDACQRKAFTYPFGIQKHIEVHPLSTVARPRSAAKGNGGIGSQQSALNFDQMLADHDHSPVCLAKHRAKTIAANSP